MNKFLFYFLALFLLANTSIAFAQSPTLACEIIGPDEISPRDTVQFSASEVSRSTHYFWSTTGGNLTIVGGNTSPTVNVQGNSAGEGKVCLTRFFDGHEPCCTCEEITIEEESCIVPSITILHENGGCVSETLSFAALSFNGPIETGTFEWEIISGVGFISGSSDTNFVDVISSSRTGGEFIVRLTYTACDGTVIVIDTKSEFLRCLTPVFPNPTKDFLTFSTSSLNSKNNQIDESPYTVQIIDQKGIVQLKLEGVKENEQMDVRSLIDGLYYVNLIQNGKTITVTPFIKN